MEGAPVVFGSMSLFLMSGKVQGTSRVAVMVYLRGSAGKCSSQVVMASKRAGDMNSR